MRKLFPAPLLLSLIATPIIADTIIDIRDTQGEQTRFLSDGNKGRMNSSTDNNYVIVDYSDQSIKVIMPDRREVMDLGGDIPNWAGDGVPEPKPVKIDIQSAGSGSNVAGYSTRKFTVVANGSPCNTIYGSKEAMKNPDLNKIFNAMLSMVEKQRQAIGGLMSDCERAEMGISDYIHTVGAPLKTVDNNGVIEHEVIQIQTNATLPTDVFVIPGSYRVVNVQQKLKEAQTEMRKGMQQYMPQMQEMMRQMQQNGKMDPQLQQQMQQMMEQYR